MHIQLAMYVCMYQRGFDVYQDMWVPVISAMFQKETVTELDRSVQTFVFLYVRSGGAQLNIIIKRL